MKTVTALDHEGEEIALLYESIEDARFALREDEWLRVEGEYMHALLNPQYVYAIVEKDE